MSISIFTILLLIYVLLKIKRNSQLKMETLENLTIKLRLEEDKNAHCENVKTLKEIRLKLFTI